MAVAFAESVWGDYLTLPPAPASPLRVVVNGRLWRTACPPELKQGEIHAALQDAADLMDVRVQWDLAAKTATFIRHGLTAGAGTWTVNGTPLSLATPAYWRQVNRKPKLYVPLQAIADALGFQAVYRPRLRTLFVNE